MHMTCKCLNFSIKSRGNELQKIRLEDLELSSREQSDPFFSEDLATVPELEGITKEQPSLVEARNVGFWVIHRCHNCSMYTHAVHREHGAALVLINTNIVVSSDNISKLRASPDYSNVFRIVINHNNVDEMDHLTPTKFFASQLPKPLQSALGALQQQLEEAEHREIALTEERIRNFTAQEYERLEHFRERAHLEHRILARLLTSSEDTNKSANSIETPPTTPDSVKGNLSSSVNKEVNNSKPVVISNETRNVANINIKQLAASKHPNNLHMNGNVERKVSLATRAQDRSSIDAEVLFPLEGMDENMPQEILQPSDQESDTDDSGHDEGIHIPRGLRGGHPTLAKSLPVSVPAFSVSIRKAMQDQDNDQLSRDPLDPHNIRASIKALAKSVHGDTVFGDLPRPRFSTQI